MKKYFLADTEAGWYQPCDTLEEAAEAADAHIAETDGDCTIQLFGRVSGRRYEPCSDFVTA